MQDIRGVPVSSAKGTSLDIYETALRALNCYRGDPVAIIDEALAEAIPRLMSELKSASELEEDEEVPSLYEGNAAL